MAERTQRRLAAIIAADVAGYSRLMRLDEEATMAAWWSYRREVIDPMVSDHGGRVVKLTGDGFLAEFASATDAVSAAIAMQSEIATRVNDVEEDKRMLFRMGINLGDILWDDEDIYGDGVNIAARIEGLADPGGILISASIYDQVRQRISSDFEDMGEQQLKNIDVPVRVYRVSDGTAKKNAETKDFETSINLDFMVPEHPSIAVLPFTVMSDDPEQEFFADGITEDIITALSKINSLLVVSRNSTFTYKGKPVDVKQIGREQGVRYVLEGSVRKAGRRVRVTAQLIDATTGMHLWAERYDRDLEDIFAVQDEITREVIIALDVQLSGGEQVRLWSSGTTSLEAWECVRLSRDLMNRVSPGSRKEAQRLLDKAIGLDPNYAFAWVMIGWGHQHQSDLALEHDTDENRQIALEAAIECFHKAIELDPSCADAYATLGLCHLSKKEFDEAVSVSKMAIELAPNNAENLALAAVIMSKSGQPEKAIELTRRAIRLCPVYPGWYLNILGTAYRLVGQIESAIGTFEEGIRRSADYLPLRTGHASILGELGQLDDARTSVAEILKIDPDFSIKKYMTELSYKDPMVMARFEDGLRKAGLPE